MVSGVRQLSAVAGSADFVLRPTQEHPDLSDIEWSSAVLEHLWNKTAVHGWGPLVILMLLGC